MSDLDLDIGFRINSAEVTQSVDATRERIRSVGAQAREQMGILERLRQAAALYQRGMEQATREDNIEKYNRRLQATNAEITRLTTLIDNTNRRGSSSFNGLQMSINQMTRELPALSGGMQMLFLAESNNIPMFTDQVRALIATNRELAATGQATVPVWKQVLGSIFSMQTALSVGITLSVLYGKQIANLLASLFKTKESFDLAKESLSNLNALMRDANKEAGKQATNLKILYEAATDATNSTKERIKAAQELKREFSGEFKNASDLAIVNGELSKTYEKLTQNILQNAKARAAVNKIAELSAKQLDEEELQRKIKIANQNENARTAKDLEARIRDAMTFENKKRGFPAPSNAAVQNALGFYLDQNNKRASDAISSSNDRKKQLQDQIDFLTAFAGGNNKIASALSATADGIIKQDKAFDQMLDGRRDILNKLADLDAEYARKSFDKDAEEQQALKDKFTQFRRIISEENDKIAKYNETHKKQLSPIDITQVDPIEKNATTDLLYRQATNKLKTSLDEQKKLYADFENYKTTFGEAKAIERYKNEIDTSKTYLQILAADYGKLLAVQAVKPLTGPEQERLKFLEEAFKDEQKVTEANSIKLLADLQSFEDKRRLIQEKGLATVEKLRKDGNNKEAENQRRKSEAELTEFDKQHVQQLDSYKALFENVDRMSTGALRKSLSGLKDEVNKLTLTPKAKEFFDKVFGDLQNNIDSNDAGKFRGMASALGEMARYAGQFDEGLGKALQTAADLANHVGNIKQGMADFKIAQGKGDTFGKITSSLGIIGSVVGIFSSIASLFDHSAERERQREEALKRQVSLIESVNKRMREQIELNKELLGDSRVKGYAQSMGDIAKKIDEQNKKLREQYALTHNDAIDKRVQNNDASFIGEDTLKKIQATLSLKDLTEDNIKALYDNGDLDDRAKAAYDSLLDLRKQQKDLLVEMNKELTGVDFSGILDGFAELFYDAEPTVEDFAKFFEKTMQDATRNAFKRDVLEESLKDWYNNFAALSKDGLTEAEKDTLQADYNKRVAEIQLKAKELEQFTGTSLATLDKDAQNNKNSLQGAYKTASQQSIDLLSANTGGLRIAAVEGNNLTKAGNATMADGLTEIKKHTLTLIEIRDLLKIISDNSDYLKHLESMDNKMTNSAQYAAGTGRVI